VTPPENKGAFEAGWKDVTITRGTRVLNCKLYYPATAKGQDNPLSGTGRPFPMIAFGHGFSAQTSYYVSFYEHLASWGYIVIAPQFPDVQHQELAYDLLFCLQYLRDEHGNSASFLSGAVDTARAGVTGHSMGGGASLLAASYDSRIRVAAPMAPAETTPSAIAATPNIAGAVCILAGSADGIAPPAQHQTPMYNAALPFKSYPMLNGGNHMRFMDVTLFDWLDPGGNMDRPTQQKLSRRFMTGVFNLFLKSDTGYWTYSYGDKAKNEPLVTFQCAIKYLPPMPFKLVSPLTGPLSDTIRTKWRRALTYNPGDTVVYTLQIASDTGFTQAAYEATTTDTSKSIAPMLLPGVYYWRVKARNSPATETVSGNRGTFTWSVPVELQDFDLLREREGILLSWITTRETNNYGFRVERSGRDGIFSSIGFVPGAGSSELRREYAFHDSPAGFAEYRLMQIDLDGGETASPIIEYNPEESASALGLELYPNPVSVCTASRLTVAYRSGYPCKATIRIFTLEGACAATFLDAEIEAGSHLLTNTVPRLPAGKYYVLFTAGGRRTVTPLVLIE
jgi:pimeloyl-ACP methyl ester carboxylesterase